MDAAATLAGLPNTDEPSHTDDGPEPDPDDRTVTDDPDDEVRADPG